MAPVALKLNAKEFKKAGQKKPTPTKDDPLRKFYTSLFKQNPDSDMAVKWLVERGCLGPQKAEKLVLMMSMKKLRIA